MALPRETPLLVGVLVLFLLVRPARAFGAGNIASISSVEGENCGYTATSAPLTPRVRRPN